MAVTASGLYVPTFRDALDASANGLSLVAANKIALFDNTITPNFTTDTAYGVAPYNSGEVTGTNWASGGVTLTTPTLTASGGALVYDADDVSVGSATFTGAVCGLIYADTLAGNEAILLVYFGGTVYSPVAGTFGITWGASIFSLDLTP